MFLTLGTPIGPAVAAAPAAGAMEVAGAGAPEAAPGPALGQ